MSIFAHIQLYLKHFIYILLVGWSCSLFSQQQDSSTFSKQKFWIQTGVNATIYGGSIAMLHTQWYSQYPQSSFHFFNDNEEWLQMDKVGHVYSSYWIGKYGYECMQWSGLKQKPSTLIGGSFGLLFLSTVEVLDGFSSGWGFSNGDMIANVGGTGLFIGQQLVWNEQRIIPKFSFHQSGISKYRPDLLGSNYAENLLKDYNGQTYWLSANIHSLFKMEKSPKWLNIAFGYSGNGMLGGRENPRVSDGYEIIPLMDRYRSYYVSLDVDFSKIKTNKRGVRILLNTLNMLKIPFPAIEFSKNGVVGKGIYF